MFSLQANMEASSQSSTSGQPTRTRGRSEMERTAYVVGKGNDRLSSIWSDGAVKYGWDNVPNLPILRSRHTRLVVIFPDQSLFQKALDLLQGSDRECVLIVPKGHYRNDERWLTLACAPSAEEDLVIGTSPERHGFIQYVLSTPGLTLSHIRLLIAYSNTHVPRAYPSRVSFIDNSGSPRRILLSDAYKCNTPQLKLAKQRVLAVAAHMESPSDLEALERRLRMIVAAFDYTHVIIVYSASYDLESIQHLNLGAPLTSIVDELNTTRDSGKYYLAAKAVQTSDGQAPEKLTFINDSFYILPTSDLQACASKTRELEKDHALVGMVSSSSPSYHMQSWWLSFTIPSAMEDFRTLLSMMRLPVNDSSTIEVGTRPPWPIIDQMEICSVGYLVRKYKSVAVYPAHLITQHNVMGLGSKTSTLAFQYLRDSGFPFFKRSTVQGSLAKQCDFPPDISELLRSGRQGSLI